MVKSGRERTVRDMHADDLARETVALLDQVAELTPWAIAGLQAANPVPGSSVAALLDRLESAAPATTMSALLPALIGELSEDTFAASWLRDCEFELWARVEQFRRTGRVTRWAWDVEEDVARVRMLSQAAASTGTWAMYTPGGPATVRLGQWLRVHWPTAPQYCLELASRDPACQAAGPAVTGPLGLSRTTACVAAFGHEGEHSFA